MRTLNPQKFRFTTSQPGDQRGAVLVIALVLLTVLTFIAVTALNSSSMEEKMAGNTQEHHRAFQTAETGLNGTFANAAMFQLKEDPTLIGCPAGSVSKHTRSNIGSYGGSTSVCTNFIDILPPPRGSGYGKLFQFGYFDMNGVATTSSQSETNLIGGVIRLMGK